VITARKTRREVLGTTLAVAVGLIAACTPAAPASPTSAPAKPTNAPAPAAPTKAGSAAATQAPAGAAATQAPAAAAAVTKPAAAAAATTAVPEVVTDPTLMPKKFAEAPMLADQVKAGKLPPVEQRLPQEPLVLKPTNETGKYGGVSRGGFTGVGDRQGIQRMNFDQLFFWDANGTRVVPNIASKWEFADEGKTLTVYLRKGMKWSDGEPFTADDIMFWYEDYYGNKDIQPAPVSWMMKGGKPATIEKVDDYTVRFNFAIPFYGFPEMASSAVIGGAFHGGSFAALALWRPAHYLKQFQPKYTPQADLDKQAKDAGFDNWVRFFMFKQDPLLNPECPVTAAWKVVSPINKATVVLERNPYYFGVDTSGNQLPYIDRLEFALAENLETLNLRAIAGQYDFQVRNVDLAKVPVLRENQTKGNYRLAFWRWPHGSDACVFFNQNYETDPELKKWLRNRDFRIALSLGINRDEMNDTFWIGLGEPGSAAPGALSQYYLGPESRKQYATFDPQRANDLLDKIGLDKKDSEGYRLRTDGQGRLTVDMSAPAAFFMPYGKIIQMVVNQWGKSIGISASVTEVEQTLINTQITNNELPFVIWENTGSDDPFNNPSHTVPYYAQCRWAPLYGLWYQTAGTQGVKPDGDILHMQELLDQGYTVPADKRVDVGKEIVKLYIDNVFVMGTVGNSPAVSGVVVVSNKMGNVPDSVRGGTPVQTPGNARPQQFYFK
jgi:peptide/nickel transport system substrate-binding protein